MIHWLKAVFVFALLIGPLFADPFIEDMVIYWKDKASYRAPTKRFLGKHSYSQIQQTLWMQGIDLRQKEFYDAVITQEERGFIGYHASSYQFRVFQDIIRFT